MSDTFEKIVNAIWNGVTYTYPTLPLMNVGFSTAKKCAVYNCSSINGFKKITGEGYFNLLNGLPVLTVQQTLRLAGKSSILGVGLPYFKEHYPHQAGAIATAALTGMDVLLSPFETAFTRRCLKKPPLSHWTLYYRAAIPQGARHGWIWGSYMTFKGYVDAMCRAVGCNPDTHWGAVATSPFIAFTVGAPMQPYYYIEAVRQAAEEDKTQKITTQTRFNLFQNLELGRKIIAEHGIARALRIFYQGAPCTLFGISCLAYIANELVLLGKQSSEPEPSNTPCLSK